MASTHATHTISTNISHTHKHIFILQKHEIFITSISIEIEHTVEMMLKGDQKCTKLFLTKIDLVRGRGKEKEKGDALMEVV